MKSIKFPNMLNPTNTETVSDYYATLQNLELLLLSEKGELFGDPYFGTGLNRYIFDQKDAILEDLLIDEIYTAIANFIPQIKITRKDITINRDSDLGEIVITIKAINRADFQTNLYNIVLTDTVV